MSSKTDLQAIRTRITKAELPEDARTTALWYLDKLPRLYQELESTYENRFLEEIVRVVKAMLDMLTVPRLVESLTIHFQAMHERHGIPRLALKSPRPAKPAPTPEKLVAALAATKSRPAKKRVRLKSARA